MVRKSNILQSFFYFYIAVICLVPMNNNNFILFGTGILILASPLLYSRYQNAQPTRVAIWFILIIIWALVTTLLHDYPVSRVYIYVPLLMAFVCMAIPYLFSKLTVDGVVDSRKAITLLSYIITASIVVYWILSLFTAESMNRLSSPVGGSATIHVVLLLTLSVYVANVRMKENVIRNVMLILLTIVLILLAGSRAGIIGAALFIIPMIFDRKRPAKSIFLLSILTTFVFVMFKFLPTERLTMFNSSMRSVSYGNSFDVVTNSFGNFLFGTGYGSVWPWYAYSMKILHASGDFIMSIYGLVLTHPHSVFLGLFVELGLIGLMPLLLICRSLIISAKRNTDPFFAAIIWGTICTLPAFMLDYYLFYNSVTSVIWWYFVFVAVSKLSNKKAGDA